MIVPSHQPVESVGRDDTGHDGREGRGGAGNLHARAAEEGDQEACDNGGVESLLRADARCDRQRDGERQRHDGDHDARHDVAGKLLFELLFGGMLDDAEQDRFDFVALQGCLIPPHCFSFLSRAARLGVFARTALSRIGDRKNPPRRSRVEFEFFSCRQKAWKGGLVF